MTTIYELEKSLAEELEGRKAEILGDVYPDDEVIECVDSWVPIYNHELAECLVGDISLGYVDDPGLLGDAPDCFKVISAAIYERLSAAGYEWLCDAQEEE